VLTNLRKCGSPKITLVSLAAVQNGAQPLQRTAPSRRTKFNAAVAARFGDGVLAHVGHPGGQEALPTATSTRSISPDSMSLSSLTQSNRRGT